MVELEALLDLAAERIANRVAERLTERQSSAPEPWVGPEQVAEHLGCKPKRVYERKDHLPHIKEGGRLLFRLSEIDAELRRNGAPGPEAKAAIRAKGGQPRRSTVRS